MAAATVVSSLATTALNSQEATSYQGKLPGIGGTFTTRTGATGTIAGSWIDLLFLRPGGIGMDFGLGYLPPSRTTDVFPAYQAVLSDIGAAYALPITSSLLLFRAGGTFLLNADGGGDLGPYVGVGLLRPLTGRLALRAGLLGRYWIEGPGLGAGVDLGLTWLARPRTRPVVPAPDTESRGIDGWTVGAGGTLYAASFGGDGLALWGPSFGVSRVTPRGIGFESGITYLVPTGFYGFTGLGLDIGLAYGVPVAGRTIVLFRGRECRSGWRQRRIAGCGSRALSRGRGCAADYRKTRGSRGGDAALLAQGAFGRDAWR